MRNSRAVIYSCLSDTPQPANVQNLLRQYQCDDFKHFDMHHANELQPGTLYITAMEPSAILQTGVSMDKAIIVFRNTRSPVMKS